MDFDDIGMTVRELDPEACRQVLLVLADASPQEVQAAVLAAAAAGMIEADL